MSRSTELFCFVNKSYSFFGKWQSINILADMKIINWKMWHISNKNTIFLPVTLQVQFAILKKKLLKTNMKLILFLPENIMLVEYKLYLFSFIFLFFQVKPLLYLFFHFTCTVLKYFCTCISFISCGGLHWWLFL